jgi:hypothetical protein
MVYTWFQGLEPADEVVCSPAERVNQLLAQSASQSDQDLERDCLPDVRYDPSIPTWFGRSSDVHEATWSTFRIPIVVTRLRVEREGDADGLAHEARRRSFRGLLAYPAS